MLPPHLADVFQMTTDQALTDLELAQLLDGALHEPGPSLSLAICDVGLIDEAVSARVFTAWASALTEHDVILPLAHDGHKLFAVVRLRTRSGVEAEMLADRLIARAADPVRVGDTLHRVKIHVGLAVATEADSGHAMVNRAFEALNRAYGVEGRNWSRALIG
jgi:hypothetical protein